MSMSDLELLQLVDTVKKQRGPQGATGVGMTRSSNSMRLVSPFDLRMVRSKGSTSQLLKMENLAASGQLVDAVKQGVLEGQVVTAAKECLVATVRTDFLAALLKRL